MVTVWLIRILLLWLTIFDGFWMVNYGFWMVNYGFWMVNYGFWMVNYGFWIYGFWMVNYGFWMVNYGFWMVNYGFWMVNHGNYGYCNPPLFRLMVNQQHLSRPRLGAMQKLRRPCRRCVVALPLGRQLGGKMGFNRIKWYHL